MSNSPVISILGTGWLGLPLGKFLSSRGYQVKGSTTSGDKFLLIQQAGMNPYQLSVHAGLPIRPSDFFESDILFLNIPFQRSLADPWEYHDQIRRVMAASEQGGIKWIIFASSTSIYPDQCGEAREDMAIVPVDERAKVLLKIEQDLFELKGIDATVIRFAGLCGGTRQIGNFLAGEKSVKRGNAPVNLIHQDDCISVIFEMIQKNVRNEIFNACADHHPSRRELYTQAAKRAGRLIPEFVDEENYVHGASLPGKVVSNHKLKKILDYRFAHPDPMSFI